LEERPRQRWKEAVAARRKVEYGRVASVAVYSGSRRWGGIFSGRKWGEIMGSRHGR